MKEQLDYAQEQREVFDYAIKRCDEALLKIANQMSERKVSTMKVTYNGVTGELIKLERKATQIFSYKPDGEMKTQTFFVEPDFDLIIYNEEKRELRAFSNVKLSDVRFSGGEVSFNA